jgi:hypothetical protein
MHHGYFLVTGHLTDGRFAIYHLFGGLSARLATVRWQYTLTLRPHMQIKLEQFECRSLLGRLLLCFNHKLPKINDCHDAVRNAPASRTPQLDTMAHDLRGRTVVQTDEAVCKTEDPSRARNRLTHSRLIALQSYLNQKA